jgi:hypothetical protein
MPDRIVPLTTSGQRARAFAALDIASDRLDQPTTAVLVDVLDAVSAGVLRAAGLPDVEARAVLAVLWGDR